MNTSEPMDTTVGPISVKTKPKSKRKKSIRDKQLQEEIQQSIRLKDGKYVMVKSTDKGNLGLGKGISMLRINSYVKSGVHLSRYDPYEENKEDI